MKHVYPPRHPAELDAAANASRQPSLPHEQDESSHSQERATPSQEEVGRKAYDNATDGTADTDRGPLMDKVYNEKVAPDRGPAEPRH